GFLLGHSTVSKDVLYFANSEPTETLVFRLHARDLQGGLIRHTATLSRKSDGQRMCELVSLKRQL
ncbi:MAG: Pnap_2097 family protein, partial [Albidovulum sp.]